LARAPQSDLDASSSSLGIAHDERSAPFLDELTGDCQAQPRAAGRGSHASVETIRDAGLFLLRDARARIDDREGGLRVCGLRKDADRAGCA
jgi:hypothetical protein